MTRGVNNSFRYFLHTNAIQVSILNIRENHWQGALSLRHIGLIVYRNTALLTCRRSPARFFPVILMWPYYIQLCMRVLESASYLPQLMIVNSLRVQRAAFPCLPHRAWCSTLKVVGIKKVDRKLGRSCWARDDPGNWIPWFQRHKAWGPKN